MQKFKNSFLYGAVILVACNLITKIIGALYRIPLLKILGSEGLGLYQMIFPIFALLLVISSNGVNVAMSKFVSLESAKRNKRNIKKYLSAGFLTAFCISSFFTLLLLFLAPKLSVYQGESGLAICYYAILPSIIISSLIATLKGYFLGLRRMLYTGAIQIVEQIVKLVFSLLLSSHFVQYGIVFAVLGTVLGITISEILSLIFALIIYMSNKNSFDCKTVLKNNVICKKAKNNNYEFICQNRKSISLKYAIKQVFNFGFFVSLESCIMPLLGALDSLTVVPLLIKCGLNNAIAYALYGLEDGIVASLVSMPTVFATSFGQSIVPNIRAKDLKQSTSNIAESFNIVWIISIASSFLFMFFSSEIIGFLYGGGLSNKIVYETKIVKDLLILNAFNIIYLSMLNLSSSILQGLEDSKTPVLNTGICAVLRIIILIVTVATKSINIYGTAIADMAFYSLAFLLNMRAIKKKININFKFSKIAIFPLLSAIIMTLTMKIFEYVFKNLLSSRLTLIVIALIGAGIYVSSLIVTKVIDIKYIFQTFFKKNKSKQSKP